MWHPTIVGITGSIEIFKNKLMESQTSQHTKVFAQRDYTEGTAVQFQTRFPIELDGRIDKERFQKTISTINAMMAEAESLNTKAVCENCFACLTAYIVLLCKKTSYEKTLKKIQRYIEEENQNFYMSKGVTIRDPTERGLRLIEFDISNIDDLPS